MDALAIANSGTVVPPFFDHILYHEACMVADGRLVHGLPSKLMYYQGTFENAVMCGWTAERVASIEQAAIEIRRMIYETRKLKLLARMRSYGYDC